MDPRAKLEVLYEKGYTCRARVVCDASLQVSATQVRSETVRDRVSGEGEVVKVLGEQIDFCREEGFFSASFEVPLSGHVDVRVTGVGEQPGMSATLYWDNGTLHARGNGLVVEVRPPGPVAESGGVS